MSRPRRYREPSLGGEDLPFLEGVSGRVAGQRFSLKGDELTVGRTDDNLICLPSEAVSRLHAYIHREGRGWKIQDNRSKNGILVNGRLHKEKLLHPGDMVQVGDCVLRYVDPKRPGKKGAGSVNLAAEEHRTIRPRVSVQNLIWFGGVAAGVALYVLLPKPPPNREAEVAQTPVLKQGKDWELPLQAPTLNLPPLAKVEELPSEGGEEAGSEFPDSSELVKAAPPPRPVTREDMQIRRGGKQKVEPGKDLAIYLNEGKHYLSQGDWESASIAYNFAILMDPRNEEAAKGMAAAQNKVRDLSSVHGPKKEEKPAAVASPSPPPVAAPPKKMTEAERRAHVKELMVAANAALIQKKYQKAIDAAEEIRKTEIPGDAAYLNEAKQVIERAKVAQKEEFEPFIAEADAMIKEGAVGAARELCSQMLQRDDSYRPAQDCLRRAEERMAPDPGKGGRP